MPNLEGRFFLSWEILFFRFGIGMGWNDCEWRSMIIMLLVKLLRRYWGARLETRFTQPFKIRRIPRFDSHPRLKTAFQQKHESTDYNCRNRIGHYRLPKALLSLSKLRTELLLYLRGRHKSTECRSYIERRRKRYSWVIGGGRNCRGCFLVITRSCFTVDK